VNLADASFVPSPSNGVSSNTRRISVARGCGVANRGGADARHLVRGDGHADAAAAHEHAAIEPALADGAGHRGGKSG
jgi:hypothetical protein